MQMMTPRLSVVGSSLPTFNFLLATLPISCFFLWLLGRVRVKTERRERIKHCCCCARRISLPNPPPFSPSDLAHYLLRSLLLSSTVIITLQDHQNMVQDIKKM